MAVENVLLKHECFPKHSRMGAGGYEKWSPDLTWSLRPEAVDELPNELILHLHSIHCHPGRKIPEMDLPCQLIGSTVSDVILRSLLWLTETRSCPFVYFGCITASSW